ncbi:MAG: carbohydrate kinase family protein [Candidatus Limnocylindrales bacterium]
MPERARGPRVVVIGDLIVDVVIAPATELETGTDVPGRVMLRQGGSAATTAGWLGRAGARVALIAAVGRDAAGRALVRTMRRDGVTTRIVRVAGHPTGRVGVFVASGGERSFVQDRGAALELAPEHLREEWFASAELLHVPAYSLLDHPLGDAGKRAAELAHAAGAVVTVDLSSARPLRAIGREAAAALIADVRPDLLFAAGDEARALASSDEGLLDLVPIVVLKRGSGGATLLYREGAATLRLEVPARALAATDTTGAGDAFDAGFILGWLGARREGASTAAGLRRGALLGHRFAARQLLRPREELAFG